MFLLRDKVKLTLHRFLLIEVYMFLFRSTSYVSKTIIDFREDNYYICKTNYQANLVILSNWLSWQKNLKIYIFTMKITHNDPG